MELHVGHVVKAQLKGDYAREDMGLFPWDLSL